MCDLLGFGVRIYVCAGLLAFWIGLDWIGGRGGGLEYKRWMWNMRGSVCPNDLFVICV